MNAEELLRRYAAGERNFTGVNLSGLKIREKVDLDGINLSQAIAKQADLGFFTIHNANLEGIDLRDSFFEECYFVGANFQKC